MSKPSSIACKTRGLTLIEVIASIALLGALMVAMLTVHSKHTRQVKLAAKKQTAATLADELIGGWFKSPEPFPANTSGQFVNNSDFRWTTQAQRMSANGNWKTVVIKLQVWHQSTSQPLIEIELLENAESITGRQVVQ